MRWPRLRLRRARRTLTARDARSTVAVLVVLALAACGLPGERAARRVDDDKVPYRLLATASPDAPASTEEPPTPSGASGPSAYWLLDEDRLTRAALGTTCARPAQEVVRALLGMLAAGPQDEERGRGRSTAIPPDSTLELVALRGATAEVEFDPASDIRADRLPLAAGQIILTVTSLPAVRQVVLVRDGSPVAVPLPGGALAEGAVAASDYAGLLTSQADRRAGCPSS